MVDRYTETRTIKVWIPRKVDNPQYKVEIVSNAGESNEITKDITGYINSGSFTYGFNNTIGSFSITLANPDGIYTGYWTGGETIKIYLGYDTYTQKFGGFVASINKNMSLSGRFLTLTGFDYTVEARDRFVTQSYSNQLITVIFKDLIDIYLPNHTYNNIPNLPDRMSIEWQDKPLLACFEIMRRRLSDAITQYDYYCDKDKDWSLFERGTITNNNEGAVYGDNILGLNTSLGVSENKNRIKIYGGQIDNIPQFYTVEDEDSQEASWVRETIEQNQALIDYDDIENYAEVRKAQLKKDTEMGSVTVVGIPTLIPGQNFAIISPLDGVDSDDYQARRITHSISGGGFVTSVSIEEPEGVANIISKQQARQNDDLKKFKNIWGMYASKVYKMDATTIFSELTDLEISDKNELQLEAGKTTGTAVTVGVEWPEDMDEFVMLVSGQDLDYGTIKISMNYGVDYTTALPETKYSLTGQKIGSDMVIKISIASDTENPNPKIKALGILVNPQSE